MKTAGFLACCGLSIALAAAMVQFVPHGRARVPAPAAAHPAGRAALKAEMLRGYDLFQATRFQEALHQFESVRDAARSSHDSYIEIRAAGNVGGCWFALHNYGEALRHFTSAQELALAAGDRGAAAAFDANIASLYSEMGELDPAVEWLERSMAQWEGAERDRHLPQLQIEMAVLRARDGRVEEANQLFRRGIDAADRAGDVAMEAVGWNRWGEELLRTGNAAAAERALLEAYRIRKLNGLPLEGSFTNLGKTRLALGQVESASVLLDRAVESCLRGKGAMPAWDAFLARGEVRLHQERLDEAMDDLRTAVRLARAWRWSIPAGDASRVGAEGVLDHIYSTFVEAGNRLYLRTKDPALMHETFEAAEENRAQSLRALVQERQKAASEMPAAYWEALVRLQRAEVASLRSANSTADEAVRAARSELVRLESRYSGDSQPSAGGLLPRARAALGTDEALLSFRVGDRASWLWALDSRGLAAYELPPRAVIEDAARAVSAAIGANAPDADEAGARLYQILFGRLDARFRAKGRWLLALDPALFDVPVAALLESTSPRRIYVAERHVTEVIPGAGFWLEAADFDARPAYGSTFLAIGDPIYNNADPRRGGPRRTRSAWSQLPLAYAASRDSARLSLPRLAASAAEVERCAREWKGPAVLLQGADANRVKLAELLRENPAVVHVAAHVLQSARRQSEGLLALSVGSSGEPELLSPAEIAHWRIHTALVVLSGCHSAAGAALPGTGLMGLTRAWLTAGARSVLASRWAVLDDDGALFAAFYRELRTRSGMDAAQALRDAQVELIHSSGWRARPQYWAAWFVVGD